jgi:hypothetical protein
VSGKEQQPKGGRTSPKANRDSSPIHLRHLHSLPSSAWEWPTLRNVAGVVPLEAQTKSSGSPIWIIVVDSATGMELEKRTSDAQNTHKEGVFEASERETQRH